MTGVALVGLGVRFAGAPDVLSLWRLLRDGRDDASFAGRLPARGFDATRFGIGERDAEALDPAHALGLEVAWEAAEDAGLANALAGTDTGVFVGALESDRPAPADLHQVAGRSRGALAARIASALGVSGPCLAVDADRAGSLAAVHLAARSVREGECRFAIAGGVSLARSTAVTEAFRRAGLLAAGAGCRFGDLDADGIRRSDGAAFVVLQDLRSALDERRFVHAVLRGSAVGQGAGRELFAPDAHEQARVIRRAWSFAGLDPSCADAIEAHGTGTPAGDEAELGALAEVFGANPKPVLVGSVKSNLGHTEGAGGSAGLVKAALTLRHGELPGTLHLRRPRPLPGGLAFAGGLSGSPEALGAPVRMGVTALGLFGEIAHLVLESAPRVEQADRGPEEVLLPITATSTEGLRVAVSELRDRADDAGRLARALVRRDGPYRVAIPASGDARPALDAWLNGEGPAGARDGRVRGAPRVAFVFAGQGSAWARMGQELCASEPVFREALTAAVGALRRAGGADPFESQPRYADQDVVQPAIFAVSVALTELWRSWGVEPDACLGHSVGEVAAAWGAGALDLDAAACVVVARSRRMAAVQGQGAMAALGVDRRSAQGLADSVGACVAAVNGPRSTVIAGDRGALEGLVRRAATEGWSAAMVDVDLACHSPVLDAAAARLAGDLAGLRRSPVRVPFYSTVTGTAFEGDLSPDYWSRNLREPVELHAAVRAALDAGIDVLLEIGPHPVLRAGLAATAAEFAGTVRRTTEFGADVDVLSSLVRGRPERAAMLGSLGAWWVRGGAPRWPAVVGDERDPLGLPALPYADRGAREADPRDLTTVVLRALARTVGRDPAGIDVRRPVRELGLGSLAAVELRGDLERQLARSLPETLFFDHPTVEAVARWLGGESTVVAPRVAPSVTSARDDVALVGGWCRLPGGVEGLGGLWDALLRGEVRVGRAPEGWAARAPTAPDDGGFLDDIETFDGEHFGISAVEARAMDPRHRLLLEAVWSALEDAGFAPDSLSGSRTGVFVGMMADGDHAVAKGLSADPELARPHDAVGDAASLAAGRIAYALGLRGPALVVDTACSSSLVATHLALRALRSGECDVAIVAGVNLMLSPVASVAFQRAGMLSPRGRCRPFDARADGYVRSEGVLAAVLLPVAAALEGGHPIRSVLAGSAVNQDGRSSGLTAPNGTAQEELLRDAWADAAVDPASIGLLEAHGTGTPLGDPIEAGAIGRALGHQGPAVALTASKGMFGHLEGAAGLLGLFAASLAIEHGVVPGSSGFERLNPAAHPGRARVVPGTGAWHGPRVAGVSSFGFSGTNAHVVVRQAPAAPVRRSDERPVWIHLTARTPASLAASRARLAIWLDARPEVALVDVAHTLAVGRARLAERFSVRVASTHELVARLRSGTSDADAPPPAPQTDGRRLHIPTTPFAGAPHGPARRAAAPPLHRVQWVEVLPSVTHPLEQGFTRCGDGVMARAVFDRLVARGLPSPGPVVLDLRALDAEVNDVPALCAELVASDAPRVVVTAGVQGAGDGVHGAAMWGFARALCAEQPGRVLRCVDLEPGSPDRLATDVWEALVRPTGEPEEMARGGIRFVPRLRSVPVNAGQRWRAHEGTWLVVGGSGAIGRRLVPWLAERGARRVIIAGRTEPDPAARLEHGDGVSVSFCRMDVSRADDVARAIALAERAGPLAGVVHAAGVLEVCPAESETTETLRDRLRAKVTGGWLLHQALGDRPAQFVVFSSMLSMLFNERYGAYAAANAWLDALCRHRRARGLPATCVQFGPWAGTGMVGGREQGMARAGVPPLGDAEAFAALELALAGDLGEVGAFRIDWDAYVAAFPSGTASWLSEHTSVRRSAPSAPPWPSELEGSAGSLRRERLAELVRAEVAGLLGVEPAAVRPGDRLMDRGVDSFLAVELRNRLRVASGAPLAATLIFDHPTVGAIASHLAEVLWPERPDPAAPDAELDAARWLAEELALVQDLGLLSGVT